MTPHPPASVDLHTMADRASTLAHLVAPLDDRLSQAIALHAARLAVVATRVAAAEAEAAADQAALTGARARYRQSEITIAELTAELAAEADINNNTPAAMEHRRQDRAKLARLFPTLVRPDGGCHLSGGGP